MKSFLIGLFVFIAVFTFGQNNEWSEPFLLTDSLSDNLNPKIAVYNAGSSRKGLLFWEKPMNDSTTALWMRNLTDMLDPIQIFYQEGVIFQNPGFFSFHGYPNPPDTLLHVFLESNVNGNFDIFLSKYSSDGNFTEPELLFGNEGDEVNMDVNPNDFVAWQVDGKIMVSHYNYSSFSVPVAIDSVNCMNPVVGSDVLAWEKIENDSSRIYYSSRDYMSGEWDLPAILFNTGHNTSLSISRGEFSGSCNTSLVWENQTGIGWKLYAADLFDQEIEDMEISNDSRLFPSSMSLDFPLKNTKSAYISHLTYAKNENGNYEIFIYGFYSYQNNISNSLAVDTKPYVSLSGYYFGSYFIHDIWHSYINEHWVLMASTMELDVSINNHSLSNPLENIQISPNPFSSEIFIEIQVEEENLVPVLEIYNTQSQLVTVLNVQRNSSQYFYARWDGSNKIGEQVKPGTYILLVTVGNKRTAKKMVLVR